MAKKERTAEEAAAKAAKKASSSRKKSASQMAISKSTQTPEQKLSTNSPFLQLTTSLYLALSPCANNFPIDGLCAEHISPHLLSYYPPLNGVLLSYQNPRLSESPEAAPTKASSSSSPNDVILAQSINEYGATFVWLTAEFLIFKPMPGTYLQGDVNLQNEGMLGLLCYNYFNVAIVKEDLPEGWTWDEENWVDAEGKVVDGKVVCRVKDFEASGQESISITGTLVGI